MTYEQALLMGRIRERARRELRKGNIPGYMRLDRLSFEVETLRDAPQVPQ